MDGTYLHAAGQRRLEWESRELARDSEPDSDRRSGEVPRGKVEKGLWKVAYPGLAVMEQTMIQQTEPDYFKDHSAVSQSSLKVFANRRRLYEAYFVSRSIPQPLPSDPMRKGTALHTALLEPESFDEIVCGWPDGLLSSSDDGIRSKAAKAYRDKCHAEGRILLKDSELATVRAMADSVRRTCGEYLEMPCQKEHAIYWTDELTGLRLKMRTDLLILSDPPIVFDLKSCRDASPKGFRLNCENNGYAFQQAQYVDGVEQATGETPRFYFIAVENEFPFACAIHEIDEESVALARQRRNQLLAELKHCLNSGDFSEPWESRINTLTLRPWALTGE
jgi:hypothetical protein